MNKTLSDAEKRALEKLKGVGCEEPFLGVTTVFGDGYRVESVRAQGLRGTDDHVLTININPTNGELAEPIDRGIYKNRGPWKQSSKER